MQEIKKRRIVLASVLKPVNDTRMTEKMGRALLHDYDVHVIAFPTREPSTPQGLTAHPLPYFKRLSFKRLIAPWQILSKVIQLKPDVFLITTHELLFTALLAKLVVGSKVIYDIQENYWRNILYTPAFPTLLRPVIASVVRLREKMAAPFINYFLLAERGYEAELTFVPDRRTVLENKVIEPANAAALPLSIQFPAGKPLHLLFTGTLAESTGVFAAITLTNGLRALDHNIKLTIIGYCALPSQLESLQQICAATDYIELIGGNTLVPHSEIIQAIRNSDLGIIAYPANPSTQNAIPTKLYEYLGNHLPILLINHPVWQALCKPFSAAVTFCSPRANAVTVLQQIRTQTFYTAPPTDVYWEAEAGKLKSVIAAVAGAE